MLSTAALASAEKIIQGALEYDPSSRIALSQLAPLVLAIHVTAPEFTIFVVPDEKGIKLLGHYEGEITTELRGPLFALISLAKSDRLNLKGTDVKLVGSTALVSELQKIFKHIEIDWEEMLTRIFGDIVGHQSAEIIRIKLNWGKDRASNIQRLTGEFLTEELRVLPSAAELSFFNSEVDDIKLGVDRMQARIERLLSRLERQGAK